MIYKTKGTCSTQIDIEVDGDIIKSVKFTGGCNGNLQGVSRLVEGMKADDAIAKACQTAAMESRLNAQLVSNAQKLRRAGRL